MNDLKQQATVIVGGGFVGLFTALRLSHQHYPHPIILIDTESRFVFKPLLYEYLSGEMHADQVVPTYEELLQGSRVTFVQAKVTQIDLHAQTVTLDNGSHYSYQHLVIGVGGTQGYFGTEGAEKNAFPFRTRSDALRLKQHLQESLKKASQTADPAERKALLTIAVVGAGPSGVEISATLADLLPAWYTNLGGNGQDIRIVLVNHGDEILQGDVNAHLQETALKALKSRTVPVELLLDAGVKLVSPDELCYQEKGENAPLKHLPTATAIWTAGTATNPLIKSLPLSAEAQNKHGLPLVSSTLQLPDFPNVFIAGDCAVVQPDPLPPVAQIAYQQGKGIADNLIALSEQRSPSPVQANMRGTLMKLGIRSGVANVFDKVQIGGAAGDLIRNETYLEMLPTPSHNFKATSEWLKDEVFERYQMLEPDESQQQPQRKNRAVIWIGVAAIAAALAIGISLIVRSRQPSQPATEFVQPQSTQPP